MSNLTDAQNAMAQLRQIRNAYLADMDVESIRFLSQGQPLPVDLLAYQQGLRDMPQNVIPTLNKDGGLNEAEFVWPARPI